MSRFFESIRLVNGRVMNLPFHQKRVNQTCKDFYLDTIPLLSIIQSTDLPHIGVYKIRIDYGGDVPTIHWKAYEIKQLRTLRLLDISSYTYDYKFSNRKFLDSCHSEKREADDCLLVKNNRITDTTYGSILLKKNKQWYTPKSVLLPSTMRSKLLHQKRIQPIEVTIANLYNFDYFKVINAMRPFSLVDKAPVSNIISFD